MLQEDDYIVQSFNSKMWILFERMERSFY